MRENYEVRISITNELDDIYLIEVFHVQYEEDQMSIFSKIDVIKNAILKQVVSQYGISADHMKEILNNIKGEERTETRETWFSCYNVSCDFLETCLILLIKE